MKDNKLGIMPISKLIWNMSLPIIVSMLVQALYNIVDSVFVSQVSEQALTAVTLAFPAQNLMIGLATGGIIMIVASCFINVFILLPAYGKAFGMPVSAFVDMAAAIHSSINSMAGFALLCVAPFNLLKVVLVSVITMLLYKHISPILKGRR